MIPFGTLLIPLDVQHDPIAGRAKELILFSMVLEMTRDSQLYSNTVIQVVLNTFTLLEIGMKGLFHRRYNRSCLRVRKTEKPRQKELLAT